MSKAKIFIVDDHQLVLDGLEKIINAEADMEIIGTANNGKDAIERVPIFKPDLVLMDLDMPVLNGMRAADTLIKQNPEIRIAMLTMHGERAIIEKMISMGVAGYFLKNADKEEFVAGIKMILKGKKFFQSDVVVGMSRPATQLKSNAANLALLSTLSDREQEVLKTIAAGKTSKEIAAELHISERTVETHRRNIHNKLEIKNLAGLVRFAIENGLLD